MLYIFSIRKYEKSKEITLQLQDGQDKLHNDNKVINEQLRLQELRYEKMKHHAMQQLEMYVFHFYLKDFAVFQFHFFFFSANCKLESLTKCHANDLTRLKASLKKEEVSKQSIAEQLNQKTKENEELVKICDELIGGQSSS